MYLKESIIASNRDDGIDKIYLCKIIRTFLLIIDNIRLYIDIIISRLQILKLCRRLFRGPVQLYTCLVDNTYL